MHSLGPSLLTSHCQVPMAWNLIYDLSNKAVGCIYTYIERLLKKEIEAEISGHTSS